MAFTFFRSQRREQGQILKDPKQGDVQGGPEEGDVQGGPEDLKILGSRKASIGNAVCKSANSRTKISSLPPSQDGSLRFSKHETSTPRKATYPYVKNNIQARAQGTQKAGGEASISKKSKIRILEGTKAFFRSPRIAMRNPRLFKGAANYLFKLSPAYPPSYRKTDARTNMIVQSLTQDVESEVNLEVSQHQLDLEETATPINRKDPFRSLPSELTAIILSYLDATSLARADLVSRDWYQGTHQSDAWRNIFRNETQMVRQKNAMAGQSLDSISGAGLGTSSPDQDFKLMLQARHELQKRWKDGRAAAIYLGGHTDAVLCLQFDEYDTSQECTRNVARSTLTLASSEKIITGSVDTTIRIWDTRSHQCLKVLGIPGQSTCRPANNVLFYTRHTSVVPTQNIRPNAAFTGSRHHKAVLCLQYDDRILVSGSLDCTCIVWDIREDYLARPLHGHSGRVLGVGLGEQHIVSCSADKTICLWDRQTGELLRRMTGHQETVNTVKLRGDQIVSVSSDGVVKLWNLTSGHCISEFSSGDCSTVCLDLSLDSRMILADPIHRSVYQFDTSTGKTDLWTFAPHIDPLSLHLDNVNGRLISGSSDTSLRAFDFATGEQIGAFGQWTTSWVLDAKSDYRRTIVAGEGGQTVIIDFGWDVPNIELLAAR